MRYMLVMGHDRVVQRLLENGADVNLAGALWDQGKYKAFLV